MILSVPLSKVNLEGKTVLSDKAFCSARIPDKANLRILHEFDRNLYKARKVVERFFLRIKNRISSLLSHIVALMLQV